MALTKKRYYENALKERRSVQEVIDSSDPSKIAGGLYVVPFVLRTLLALIPTWCADDVGKSLQALYGLISVCRNEFNSTGADIWCQRESQLHLHVANCLLLLNVSLYFLANFTGFEIGA